MIRIFAFALLIGTVARPADAQTVTPETGITPSGPAQSAKGPPAPAVYGLSPEEKAAVLESASRRADADNPALLPGLPGDRRVHGEMGAMVGTGGARGIYGIIGVPLGETGSATFAYSNTQGRGYGYGPYGYNPYGYRGQSSFGLGLRQPGW